MGSRLFDEDEVKKRTIGGKKLATKHKKTAHNPECTRADARAAASNARSIAGCKPI